MSYWICDAKGFDFYLLIMGINYNQKLNIKQILGGNPSRLLISDVAVVWSI